MKKGNAHGHRAGDRHHWMRLRVSEKERQFLHQVCTDRNQTVSRMIRVILKKNGLLPDDSLL